MKKPTKYILSFLIILIVILACTKQVGLYTEVEFELTETHETDGYINTALATAITVIPEEIVEGYSYSYSYKINSGAGYFEDELGTIISEGEKIALDPLTASLNYIATEIGDHSIVFTAEDSFGFTEQVIATYLITDIPVTWTVSASTDQILLGDSETISIVLGSETEDQEVTYERNYSFTEGTGTLTTSEGNNEILNELVEITTGTYELEFTATELSSVTIEFLLEDSNGQEVIETVSFEVVEVLEESDENSITSFELEGITIDNPENEFIITLPSGTDVTALTPMIIHDGESINPDNIVQDFSSPVTYTVTAENDDTQEYTVTVALEVEESDENSITSFELEGITIDNPENEFTITLPAGTDVTALTPMIIHDGESINPDNTAQDFSSPVTYTVTAENDDIQEYIVTVELESGNEPTAENFDVIFEENSTSNLIDVAARIADDDGDSLTVSVAESGEPLNGTVTFSGTEIYYTPNTNFFGNDQIEYSVSDGTTTVNAIISITVSETIVYKYHRVEFLGSDKDTATTNYCNDTYLNSSKLNIAIDEMLMVDDIYLVSGATEIADGYYIVVIATDTESGDADENISGDFFSNNISLSCTTEITFDPSTGIYTAPAGSTVTVDLYSYGSGGIGDAEVEAYDLRVRVNTEWVSYAVDDEFSERNYFTFTMPESGSVSLTGYHDETISGLDIESSSYVTISNSDGISQYFTMDVDNGMPQ